jgi:hypothetical protein
MQPDMSALKKKQPYILFILRPIFAFFSALAINLILHELSHAIAAYLVGVKSTMYQLYVNPDTEHASKQQNIFITATGPIFSLMLGLFSWLLFKKYSVAKRNLFFLYSSIFGISIFLGNLFATSLGGDFHTVADKIGIPNFIKYILSIIGVLSLCYFMYKMGKHFMEFKSENENLKKQIILILIVLPVIFGTLLTIIVYMPLPQNSISNRIIESFFWLFTLVGAIRHKKIDNSTVYSLSKIDWADIAITVGTVITIRIMSLGISFTP